MESKNQVVYFEWLRIFAAAAVVVIHTTARVWYDVPWDSADWHILSCWNALVRWPVPVFVMVTGAIFLPRKTPMKAVLTRYIPRMLLCYLLWAWLYARYEVIQGAAPETFWKNMAAGQYHLWYLPFLCGVYLTLPFLQKIAEDKDLTGRLLAVSLTVGSLIPWLIDLAMLMRPGLAPYLTSVKGHLNYTFFLDLMAALVLGHWLNQREYPVLQRRVLYGFGVLSLVLTMAGTMYLTAKTGKAVSLFLEHSSPLNICTAAAIFVFAKYNLTRLPRFAEKLAKASFGIYLSHPLLIEVLYDRHIHALAWNPVWSVPVLAAAVFAISAIIAAVLAKIPVIGKYLA